LFTCFPEFEFAHDADLFLATIPGISTVEQLLWRRIQVVEIMPLIVSSGGIGYTGDGNFFIALNDTNTEAESIRSLGHEVAHTFHFDLKKTPPEQYPDLDRQNPRVESFCHRFSKRWIRLNKHSELSALVHETRYLSGK